MNNIGYPGLLTTSSLFRKFRKQLLMEYLLPIVCSILLIALIASLIFKDEFRHDILATEGEASIFGILTVKGVAIIILTGLFLGGLIWSFSNSKKYVPRDLSAALATNHSSQIGEVNLKIESIENLLMSFYSMEYIPSFASDFVKKMPSSKTGSQQIELISKASRLNVLSFRNAVKKLQQLREKCYFEIDQHYNSITNAINNGDLDVYRKMITTKPVMIKDLNKLDSVIEDISKNNDQRLENYFDAIDRYIGTDY
jgi:hypothetical protein